MESLTTHNPHVCLSADDLEALNTLYPVNSGAVLEPSCRTSPMYLGFVRMTVYVIGPLTLALFLSICLHTCLRTRDQAEMAHARRAREAKSDWLQTSAMANEVSRSRVNDDVAWQAAEAAAALVNAVPADRSSRRTLAYQSNYPQQGGMAADAPFYGCSAGAVLGASSVSHLGSCENASLQPMGLPPFALDNPSALYAPAPADHGRALHSAGGEPHGMISAHYSGSMPTVPLAALPRSDVQSAQRSRKRSTEMMVM